MPSVMPLALNMTHEFKAPWWSIQVATGWFSEQEDECATFWREDGVGALQISAHSHDTGTVPQNDLDDFTRDEFPDGAALEVHIQPFPANARGQSRPADKWS